MHASSIIIKHAGRVGDMNEVLGFLLPPLQSRYHGDWNPGLTPCFLSALLANVVCLLLDGLLFGLPDAVKISQHHFHPLIVLQVRPIAH